jgi:hypothetical protein
MRVPNGSICLFNNLRAFLGLGVPSAPRKNQKQSNISLIPEGFSNVAASAVPEMQDTELVESIASLYFSPLSGF